MREKAVEDLLIFVLVWRGLFALALACASDWLGGTVVTHDVAPPYFGFDEEEEEEEGGGAAATAVEDTGALFF